MTSNRIIPCIISLSQFFTTLALAYVPGVLWLYAYAAFSILSNFLRVEDFLEGSGIDLSWIGLLYAWVMLRLDGIFYFDLEDDESNLEDDESEDDESNQEDDESG